MASSKVSSSARGNLNRLLVLVVAVVFVVFAVLVTRQVINLKNRHSGRSSKTNVAPTLAPPAQFTQ